MVDLGAPESAQWPHRELVASPWVQHTGSTHGFNTRVQHKDSTKDRERNVCIPFFAIRDEIVEIHLGEVGQDVIAEGEEPMHDYLRIARTFLGLHRVLPQAVALPQCLQALQHVTSVDCAALVASGHLT